MGLSRPNLAGYGEHATTRDPNFPATELANYVVNASAGDALDVVIQVARLLRDDDEGLCWMAADTAFEMEARQSVAIRKVWSLVGSSKAAMSGQ